MEEFSPFISVSGGESSGGTTNPSDIQNVNQDADETVNSAVGAIVDEQRAAKRKSSSPGLETNVPPKKLQSPKTQSVACVASCHKHATSVFDEKLGSGANLSNTRTFDRELKGWFKARVPADREANKAWICSACVAYGKAVLGGTSEEELSKHAEESM
ncbi:unnamed protein product [Orchesella dallaii]|uniref:BED-type domain-containing protein n=1 Tax=Orchesella dallaii TaxID=48710 RepID=A0ABP1Q387_9HEXA